MQGEHGIFPGEQGSPARIRFRQRLYRACARVQTVSEDLRNWIIEREFDPEKIVAIVNGVDTDRFQPGDPAAARRQLGIPETGPVIGIVGRFVPDKKHRVLFDAFDQIADEFPTARVLVVGDGGSAAEEIRAAAAASRVADRIHLVGYQSDPLPCYRAMDVLAAPSPAEGLSNAVLESMSCGLNVLSHSACGVRDVITHGRDGFTGSIDTPAGLVEQLRPLLAAPERRRDIGRAARETMLERFTLQRMADDYAALYRELAGEQPLPATAEDGPTVTAFPPLEVVRQKARPSVEAPSPLVCASPSNAASSDASRPGW